MSPPRFPSPLATGLLGILVLAARAPAQSVRTLVLEEDEYFGAGKVLAIKNLRVNDDGDWIVHVDTDAVPAPTGDVLLRNGIVTLRGGDPLAAPPGATVGKLGELSFNGGGGLGMLITLHNWDLESDAGAYFDSYLVAQESQTVLAPEFTPGTPWVSFDDVRVNDSRRVLLVGEVADPALSGTKDWTLLFAEIDGAGAVTSQRAVLWETGPLPGVASVVQKFGADSRALAFNAPGDFLVFVDSSAAGDKDGMLIQSSGSSLHIVAREGSPSPLPGRNWKALYNKPLTLNDLGEFAYIGSLTGDTTSDLLLVKNDEKYVQEGDLLPELAPFRIVNFQNTPIHLSNSGDLFWFGLFDETDYSKNTGIFRNKTMLVQEGTTPASGQRINGLRTSGNSFFISPNGRYLIFEAVLFDRREGAFLLDLGLVERMSECRGNPASLELGYGLPLLGHTLYFELDGAQGFGVTPVLMVSTLPVAGWPECGLALPFGELLIDVSPSNGNPALFRLGRPWYGLPSEMTLDIPDDLGLAGLDVYVQGLFWDVGDVIPEENLRLTGARHVHIVAP